MSLRRSSTPRCPRHELGTAEHSQFGHAHLIEITEHGSLAGARIRGRCGRRHRLLAEQVSDDVVVEARRQIERFEIDAFIVAVEA